MTPARNFEIAHDETDTTEKALAGGSAGEALAGAGAAVLAILALSGVFPVILTAIGVIAIGVAFLFQGAAIASHLSMVRAASGVGEVATGTTTELVGGLAGIVLGILALVGVAPLGLIAVSAIVFGGTLLFGSPTIYSVAEMGRTGVETLQAGRRVVTDLAAGASGAQALIGIGSATLGILALVGIVPHVLEQVAVLCVGAGALLSGGAITSKMVALLAR
jgi:hypothetical protein